MLLTLCALACLGSPSATNGALRFEPHADGVRAVLDAALKVGIDARGATLSGQGWTGTLATSSFGRTRHAARLERGETRIALDRVELRHPELTEWFVRGDEGVEQGWTIAAPPSGERLERLWIGLDVGGDVSMRIAEDGLSARFTDAHGAFVASYLGLSALDAAGRALAARLESSPRGAGISIDDRDATYPITVDPWIGTPFWSRIGAATDAYLGTSVRGAGDVNGDGFSDVLVAGRGFVQIYHGSSSGLSSSPSSALFDPSGTSGFGTSVSAAGDFNGDGYDDVIVGAPYDSTLQYQAGKVYVFAGSAAGVAGAPIYTYALPSYYSGGHAAWCGWSVTFVGDLNNDGRSEIAFGIPYDNPNGFPIGSPGTVRVVFGGTLSMTTISPPSGTNQGAFGWAVVNAGDTDADGDIELFVTALDYQNGGAQSGQIFGVRFTGTTPTALGAVTGSFSEQCGFTLGGGGDINGDGRTDLVAALPGYSSNLGRAFAMNGMPPGGAGGAPFWTADGTTAGGRFGESVAIAGDVNGDGFADVVTGAPNYNGTVGAGEGRAYLYFGGASGMMTSAAFTLTGDGFDQHTGSSVAAAGDVNGDGYGDFLVAARDYNDYNSSPTHFHAGRVWLFYGHASESSAIPVGYQTYLYAFSHTGQTASYIGDVNGDGYDDTAVAMPGASNNVALLREGRVEIYAGSAVGSSGLLSAVDSNVPYAYFGSAVAGLGDVDGDGFADVAVGAPGYVNGQAGEGAVFVYRGSASGLVTPPAWTIEGDFPNIHWGSALASSLDVNGDGYGDLAVGCRDCYGSFSGEGEIWLYFGGPLGLSLSNPWVVHGGQANAHLGESVASAGDIDADGFGDLIAGAPDFENGQAGEGVVYVWRGSLTGLASTPAITSEGDFPNIHWGRKVAGIGDVNGDGYSDVVVGCPQCYSSQPEQGEAWVMYGAPGGLSGGWVHGGDHAGAHHAGAVAAAGDVNGDGFGDLIVGTPDQNAGYPSEGRAEIFLGSSSGLAAASAWHYDGNFPGDQVGSSVASTGDINGDGFADFVFGAPYLADGTFETGAQFLVQGNTLAQGFDSRSGVKTRSRQKIYPTGLKLVALGGTAQSTSGFVLDATCIGALANSSTPAGRTRVQFHLEAREQSAAFQPSGFMASGFWASTGATGGTPASYGVGIGALTDFRGYKWRTRVRIDDPFFPRTPWTTLSGRAMSEVKLRTARDCNGNGTADSSEILAGAPDTNHDQLLDACASQGTLFCFGDGTGTACPCGNNSPSSAQSGCTSSLAVGGKLVATGNASIAADTLVLRGTNMPNSSALYFEGTIQQSGGLGTVFGDGKRCASGTIIRLGTKTNASGASTYPAAGDAAIHTRRPITVPGTYTYQVWYRNAAAFCTASTFNLSNGVQIAWGT